MRAIPPAFTGGAMTLAHCWLLTRRDGVKFGFTDHDMDIEFSDLICIAQTGLSTSDLTDATGFEVTGGDLLGALTSAGITESDISAGLYDGAMIEIFLVDWTDVATNCLIERGTLGEFRRNGGQFICEMRGLSSLYQEEKGRIYQHLCTADLGDAQCGVGLSDPRYHLDCAIVSTDSAHYIEIAADPDLYRFDKGKVEVLTGANQGQISEVKSQISGPGLIGLYLWTLPAHPIGIGDQVRVTVGCDKSFATCRTIFSNSLNFRGFPHIPGPDFILEIAKNGDAVMDGGSLFK